MAPIGKDGFSDCRVLCDPIYGYSQSCKEQCEGIYSFEPSTATTVSSSTSTPTTSFSASSDSVTNNNMHFPDSNNDDDISEWVYIMIGILCTLFIVVIVYNLRKRLLDLINNIMQWIRNKVCKRLPESAKEGGPPAIEMTEVSETLLEESHSVETENARSTSEETESSRNSTTGFLRPRTDNSLKHYDDGKFHRIHEGDATDTNTMEESESESESENELHVCIAKTGTNSHTDTDETVPKWAVQNKGVIRITTEIDLR